MMIIQNIVAFHITKEVKNSFISPPAVRYKPLEFWIKNYCRDIYVPLNTSPCSSPCASQILIIIIFTCTIVFYSSYIEAAFTQKLLIQEI